MYRKKFFDFFEPDKQEYEVILPKKDRIKYYNKCSQEEIKVARLPADFIKGLELPKETEEKLLKYSRENTLD